MASYSVCLLLEQAPKTAAATKTGMFGAPFGPTLRWHCKSVKCSNVVAALSGRVAFTRELMPMGGRGRVASCGSPESALNLCIGGRRRLGSRVAKENGQL